MPALNGIGAASVIQQMLPKTRVILFSNHTKEIGTTLASAVGIDLVMAKGSLSDMARSLKTLNDRNARE